MPPHVSGEDLHNKAVVLTRVPGDALEAVYPAQAHVELFIAKLVDRTVKRSVIWPWSSMRRPSRFVRTFCHVKYAPRARTVPAEELESGGPDVVPCLGLGFGTQPLGGSKQIGDGLDGQPPKECEDATAAATTARGRLREARLLQVRSLGIAEISYSGIQRRPRSTWRGHPRRRAPPSTCRVSSRFGG